MSLPSVEQIILNYIQTNRNIREFWDGKIGEWRSEGKSEDEVAVALADNLQLIYMSDESAREDLEGLIDYVSIMTANYNYIAFALLNRDFRTEAVTAMIKAPTGWPEPYYIFREGKTLGPYSYAQIRIKWADEDFTAEDKAYHEPSRQWRPLRELAEPWTAEDFVQPPPIAPPAPPKRIKGTKERPLQIAENNFMVAMARAAVEIDGLFGKDKWELFDYSDYKDGARCWTVKIEGNPVFEEVWIASSGLATPKMPDGRPNILMERITHQDIATYRKLLEDAFHKRQMAQAEALAKPATKPDKNEESNFTTYAGCGCAILGFVGVAILVFASRTETRIWTVVVGVILMFVFSSLSQYFDNRKKKRAEEKKP